MIRLRQACQRSVLAQALALNLGTALAVGGLTSGIFILTTRRVVIQQVKLRADEVAKAVATRAQFPMLVGDRSGLDRLAQETMRLDDVLYIQVTDREGGKIYLGRAGFARPENLAAPAACGFDAKVTCVDVLPGAEYVEADLAIPRPDSSTLLGMEAVNSTAASFLGNVRIGLPLRRAREASIAAVWRTLGATALGLAIILRRQARQLRRKLAPLRNLAAFTRGITEGNLDRRAEVVGVDEIGNLALSFNQMLDRLTATLVSKDLAEQANQAKGRFIATASHELRTPLHAIIGYSELLEEECAESGHKEILPDLGKIRNSGRMLLSLVNDLLDYSKAEEGRLHLALDHVPVASVIQEVAGLIEPLLRQNGNRLIAERVESSVTVYADRAKFLQGLLNLASNACKFTEHGTITLGMAAVGVAATGGERRRCGISVSDTGIGIAQNQVGQLFEAFVQLDSSNTRKYGGTGLGLAVSRKFCRHMDGDITVESELGQGSTFTIWLPAEPPETAQELSAEAETTDRATTSG